MFGQQKVSVPKSTPYFDQFLVMSPYIVHTFDTREISTPDQVRVRSPEAFRDEPDTISEIHKNCAIVKNFGYMISFKNHK